MLNRKIGFRYCLILVLLCSCLTAGTHGSIISFQFSTSKYNLERAVEKVIDINQNIQRDTTKAYDDSTKYGYYNDGTNYMTIRITKKNITYKYIFKYAGDKKYWDSSKISNIFIAYAYDNEGNGGSEGNGGISWYKFGLKKKLIFLFESELVNKIDSILGQRHIVID